MRWFLLIFCLSCLQASPKPPLKLESLKVHLIYSDSGTLSKDLVTHKNFVLWNTIIGEGDAEGPTDRLMLWVHIKSPKKQGTYRDQRIVITVKENKKVKSETEHTLGFFSNHSYYLPYIIEDIGCEPIDITVKIKGDSQSLEKQIPFQCGE